MLSSTPGPGPSCNSGLTKAQACFQHAWITARQRSILEGIRLAAQQAQDFVASAHGVVVGLAGGALFIRQLAVLAIEDAIPRTMLVVDEMLPCIGPQPVVIGRMPRVAGACVQQGGGGDGLGL